MLEVENFHILDPNVVCNVGTFAIDLGQGGKCHKALCRKSLVRSRFADTRFAKVRRRAAKTKL
jgi:hypothetical protein